MKRKIENPKHKKYKKCEMFSIQFFLKKIQIKLNSSISIHTRNFYSNRIRRMKNEERKKQTINALKCIYFYFAI